LTQWIIVITVSVVAVIDIGLALSGGKNATISVQITQWSKQYPIIPFAFGVLMGHFFGQNN
jgi:ABC-type uncharacterized transport system YnjBCD permease subunit